KLGIFMPSNVEILARLYRKQERLLLADQLEWDYNAISNPDDIRTLTKAYTATSSSRTISAFGDAVLDLSEYVLGIDESHLPLERIAIQVAFCKQFMLGHRSSYDQQVLKDGYLLLARFLPEPDGPAAMVYWSQRDQRSFGKQGVEDLSR